jgi:hypothetical protein
MRYRARWTSRLPVRFSFFVLNPLNDREGVWFARGYSFSDSSLAVTLAAFIGVKQRQPRRSSAVRSKLMMAARGVPRYPARRNREQGKCVCADS